MEVTLGIRGLCVTKGDYVSLKKGEYPVKSVNVPACNGLHEAGCGAHWCCFWQEQQSITFL